MRHPLIPSIVISSAVMFAAISEAYDQQIYTTLWAEGYSVPARDGSIIRRRRIVEDLRLGAWNLLPGSDHPYYRGPRLSTDVALRLGTDFAVSREESNPAMDSAYVPGLTPMQMDAIVAEVDVRGLWSGVLDVRAGRQIRVDTLGFFAFDGAATSLNLPIGLSLDTYLGYEVRGGDMLGYDELELDGIDSGGRRGMEPDRFPDRTDPKMRMAIGAELVFSRWRWLDTAVGFRAVGLSQQLSDERVGGRLRVGGSPVWIDTRAVWSPMLDLFSEIDAEASVAPHEALVVSADYHLFRPVFEGDSIFNVFDLAPQNDLGGRVEVRFSPEFSVATWGFTRISDRSAGISGEEKDALVSGVGGGAGGDYATPIREVSLRLNGVEEWGESRVGAELGAGHALLKSGRLWLGFRVSGWHIDDSFSERLAGNLLAYVISARFRIANGADLLGEIEHYLKEDREQRFSALALLKLDLWR